MEYHAKWYSQELSRLIDQFYVELLLLVSLFVC